MRTKQRCFLSYHHQLDCWRAAQIRNIESVATNRPAIDEEWDAIKKAGDFAIKRWIDEQLVHRSCTVVLVGAQTANRRWINYEICRSWNEGMGVVGIRVHGLTDEHGANSDPGQNPFDYVAVTDTGEHLSSLVKLYDPPGATSFEKCRWLAFNLNAVVDEAIRIRQEALASQPQQQQQPDPARSETPQVTGFPASKTSPEPLILSSELMVRPPRRRGLYDAPRPDRVAG